MNAVDVMQVCANGHVITDLLETHPDRALSRCDRCGAPTIERCRTCGHELPGAIPVPGLTPVGTRRPPQHCPTCGASFPWTAAAPAGPARPALAVLDHLLRRLPRAARQLRSRHGNRPAFCVQDIHDLEDLVRALLPLHFDNVRPECRTPRYAPATRTDYFLPVERMALVVKYIVAGIRPEQLATQLREDIDYYEARSRCETLVVLLYDPEQRLYEREPLTQAVCRGESGLQVRLVVAS